MKKVLSLVLVLSIVLGSFGFAFAAPATQEHAGDVLKGLGVLQGVNAAGDLDLGRDLNRQDMIVLLSRLLGQEETAKNFGLKPSFTDVTTAFYVPYIAWAEANNYTQGIGGGKFGFGDALTVQHTVTFLMRALGYDPEWNAAPALAVELGLVENTNGMSSTATRGKMAELTLQALFTPMNGEEFTLGTFLKYEGFELEEEVVVPEELEVVSVSATNLKQIEIIFNQAVTAKSAETKGNYRLNELALATNDTVELQADGRTVVITLDGVLANGTKYDIVISKVVSADDVEMDKFEGEFVAIDNVIPEALALELIGPRHVEITFNEPIQNMSSVALLVNNGAVGAINKGAKIGTNNTVLEVEIPTNLTEGTEYTVRISGAQDYANFTMVPRSLSFTFVKDTTPPVVTLKSATQEVVTLEFSKPVKNLTANKFYHTFASWQPAITDADGNAIVAGNYYSEVKLNFNATNRPLPEGTNNVVILVGPTNGEIQDLWGNKIAETTIPVTVTADRTAPVVSSVEAKAEDKVEVTFSKNVQGAGTSSNFEVKDAEGKEVTNFTVDYTTTNSVYKSTLNFTADLDPGNYTVTIKNVKDLSLYENALGTVTYSFAITDLTAPNAITTTVVGNDVYVMFNEAVATSGDNSALNKANYRLAGAALPSAVTLTMFDNRTVRMTGFTSAPSGVLTVKNVADVAGNKMGLFAELTATLTPVVAPQITGTKTVDLNKIEITVNQRLRSVDANSIQITAGGATHLAAAASYENKANGTSVVTVTLNANNELASTADISVVVDVLATGNGVVSLLGSPMVAGNGVQGTVTDGIAPRVDKVVFVNSGLIKVYFTENLDASTLAAAGLNGFSVVGGTLNKAALVNPAANGTIVLLEGSDFTVNTDVVYNNVAGITDVATNKLASFTRTNVLTAPAITVVPSNPVDNKFTVTTNFNGSTLVIGGVDMDTTTTAVDATVVINGITYTATVTSGEVTIAATAGAATATAGATTHTLKVTVDGVSRNVVMNISAVTAADAFGTVAVTVNAQ